MKIPKYVERYYTKYKVLPVVKEHSRKTALASYLLAEELNKKGAKINLNTLWIAGLLHDILKCVDFKDYEKFDQKTKQTYIKLKKQYPYHHTKAAYEALKKYYPKEARIILMHGFERFPKCKTMEEKILSYVDKRVKHDHIATLKERFTDLEKRYKKKSLKTDQNSIKKIRNDYYKFEKELIKKVGKKDFEKIFKNVK